MTISPNTAAKVADALRHLVADTSDKMDQELDRGYLMEDLLARMLNMAEVLDGRHAAGVVADLASVRTAYELCSRDQFGMLSED